jgi:hypothetical protein
MSLGDEYGQRQPLAIEEIPSRGDAKAHRCHTQIDEITMRAWVGEPLRNPGELDATLAQLLCLVRRGHLEVDIDRVLPGARILREALR